MLERIGYNPAFGRLHTAKGMKERNDNSYPIKIEVIEIAKSL